MEKERLAKEAEALAKKKKRAEEQPAEEEEEQPAEETAEEDEIAATRDDEELDEEIDDAEDDENDEEDDVAAPVAAFGGLRIRSKYNKSFTAKMMLSEENVKQYYCEVVNRLLSYKKATYRVYWRQASVRAGMKTLAKFAIRGKTLYMYLALDPQQYVGTKYAAKDMSQVKKYASVPVRVKIKSPRSVKFANELVEKLADYEAGSGK